MSVLNHVPPSMPAPHIAEKPEDYAAVEPDGERSGADRRHGQTLRLAMALVAGATDASADRASKANALRTRMASAAGSAPKPESDADLVAHLHRLARTGDRNLAEQLRLLPRFDEARLWQAAGCRDCLQWMDRHLGIHRVAAYERLRVARALSALPVIESLFALGKLSYSKVRELTRVADADSDRELAAAVLDLSVSETISFCQRWRFGRRDPAVDSDSDSSAGPDVSAEDHEAAEAMEAFENRGVGFRQLGRGRARITVDLPLEMFAEFVKALECAEDQLREDEPASGPDTDSPVKARTARQLRADALLHLAGKSLAHDGEAIAKADRYRVLVSAPVSVVGAPSSDSRHAEVDQTLSDSAETERSALLGFGPIADATARRLAETATLTILATLVRGEVVGVAHDTRLWPRPMVRAVLARDRCCQMPGCTRSRFVQVHHVVPVAEGGLTEITNAALVCSTCHRALHEGGLRLEPVTADDVDLGAAADEVTLTETERARACQRVASVQRFRLLQRDGAVVAGPKRRSALSTCRQRDAARVDRLMSLIANDVAA